MRKKRLALCASALMVAAALAVAGCAPSATEKAPDEGSSSNEPVIAGSTYEYDAEGPIVTQMADGTLVQRTPSIAVPEDIRDRTHNQTDYNTEYLMADARGCNACHEDLGKTLENAGFNHLRVSQGLDVQTGYVQCTVCHFDDETGSYRGSLGTTMHAIHNVSAVNGEESRATCFNCHDVDTATNAMTMWDEEKHNLLQGITKVADVSGDFAFDQNVVNDFDEVFNANWLSGDAEKDRWYKTVDGVALDEELFENWPVSVTGAVENEVSWKLGELIEIAPVETKVMKMHCAENPLGGAMIANVEVTGIPVRWLLEQAGLSEDAKCINGVGFDGYGKEYWSAFNLADFEDRDIMLVYEINGERLSWEQGYPLQLWIGGWKASTFTKQTSQIMVSTDEAVHSSMPGDSGTMGRAKPNVGVLGMVEGQIVKAGEPLTIEGYADAFEQCITAVEFSMDGGATWTTFETPGTDNNRWVHWTFEWTPAADVETAYVLQVRTVSDAGRVTPEPYEIMVNAKVDPSALAQ